MNKYLIKKRVCPEKTYYVSDNSLLTETIKAHTIYYIKNGRKGDFYFRSLREAKQFRNRLVNKEYKTLLKQYKKIQNILIRKFGILP